LLQDQLNDRAITNLIVQDYQNTLNGAGEGLGDADINFMVHNIVEFNERLQVVDPNPEFGAQVATLAPEIQKQSFQKRFADAVDGSETKAEVLDKFFDSSINYTSDPQNVHDGKVNADLRATLERLRCVVDPRREISDLVDYARECGLSKNKIAIINSVLERVREGNYISTFADHEDKILSYVWKRCSHPENAGREVLMKDAVLTALLDCVENGNIVCINGRTGRLLNCFVTLDFDEEVSRGAMTFEAYRNQIFQETKTILDDCILRAVNSGDPDMRAVGESYDSGAEAPEEAEQKFLARAKQLVDDNIDMYAGKLSVAELQNVRSECHVYLAV
jgi:hypothetical protein